MRGVVLAVISDQLICNKCNDSVVVFSLLQDQKASFKLKQIEGTFPRVICVEP